MNKEEITAKINEYINKVNKLEEKLKDFEVAEEKYVRKISEYSDSEKIEEFDKLYFMALDHLKKIETSGEIDDYDVIQYFFEAVMDLLSKEKDDVTRFWDYYDKLLK
jgi:hypothetical protein